jgi:hypothetical protein
MRNYIPVDVDDLPDIFDIKIVDEVFVIRIDYNSFADFYTITIQKDEKTLIQQEPLILGQLVGIDIPDSRLPRIDIRVMDETEQATDAGQGNFGENVKLYFDVVDPYGSETIDPTIKPLGFDPDETADDETDEEVSY